MPRRAASFRAGAPSALPFKAIFRSGQAFARKSQPHYRQKAFAPLSASSRKAFTPAHETPA
jgi:hypothetical protein